MLVPLALRPPPRATRPRHETKHARVVRTIDSLRCLSTCIVGLPVFVRAGWDPFQVKRLSFVCLAGQNMIHI